MAKSAYDHMVQQIEKSNEQGELVGHPYELACVMSSILHDQEGQIRALREMVIIQGKSIVSLSSVVDRLLKKTANHFELIGGILHAIEAVESVLPKKE